MAPALEQTITVKQLLVLMGATQAAQTQAQIVQPSTMVPVVRRSQTAWTPVQQVVQTSPSKEWIVGLCDRCGDLGLRCKTMCCTPCMFRYLTNSIKTPESVEVEWKSIRRWILWTFVFYVVLICVVLILVLSVVFGLG
jgi:hypothetical protein